MNWDFFWFALPRVIAFVFVMVLAWRIATWKL